MHDIAAEVLGWHRDGLPVATATVARVHGSGLAPLGSVLACTADGRLAGSVSGGCIEGAVVEEAVQALADGAGRLLEFGVTDELAWEVGLACGGSVEVWVQPSDAAWFERAAGCLAAGERVARSTLVAGPAGLAGRSLTAWPDGPVEGDVPAALAGPVEELARTALASGEPDRAALPSPDGQVQVLTEAWGPRPRLVIVGAVHIAIPLVTMAKALGYRTVVVDARSAFATAERFPHADELIVGWPSTVLAGLRPDRATDVVVLTHDDKVDVPVLQEALRSRARYVGILGSRGHQAQRAEQLRERGVGDAELARIHGPVGLPLGAKGPAEIAVAVLAELVATRHPARAAERG